jgi:exopolysaccharide production protein ExoZ
VTASASRPPVKLLSIELARGVAAVIVVLYHAARHLDRNIGFAEGRQLFQFGHAGVDFFFVISGFIILFVHGGDLGRPGRIGHYAARRFTRIYPIYWVILGLTVALAARSLPQSPLDVAWAATLLPTGGEPMVGVAWTLQHEMVFYGVFAVLIVHVRAGMALLGLWLGAMAYGALPSGPRGIEAVFVSAYNLEFFFGMAAAWWLRRHEVARPGAILALGLSLFALFALAEVLGRMDGYAAWARLAYGLPSALIILGLVELERGMRIGVPARLLWLGRASYSIYLFHLFGIGLAYKLWVAAGLMDLAPAWIGYGVISAAGIGGGIAVSRLVEYPLMGWTRRLLARR